MHRILKQSYNIPYLNTIFKYCIIKHYIFNHTIRKYSDSYLYLEYFQKSNLVLWIFSIFLAIPETKSKSHSQDSGFTLAIQKSFLCNNQRYTDCLCAIAHSKVAAIRLQLKEQLIAPCNRAFMPAQAFLRGGLCCCFLIPSSCYNLRTYIYFLNFSISIN